MRNVRYDYSSCHIDVPSPLADEIVEWGKENVSDEDLYVTQKDPTFGREDEIHITILYGLHCEEAAAVRDAIQGAGPVTVTLGEMDTFSNPFKFDVVVVGVYSDDLCRLNEKLQKKVKFTNRYPIYNPHVTVAFVQKGKGWRHVGNTFWAGRTFTANYAVFSSKNGSKERIAL